MVIHHIANEELSKSKNEATAADLFILNGSPLSVGAPSSSTTDGQENETKKEEDGDEVMIVDDIEIVPQQVPVAPNTKKRAREEDEEPNKDGNENPKILKSSH
jgi:NACalpha-BTF3-like transcription factor